jgi:O-acetyl-ADP-ribose deacetylase (regulator of RNase III)
MEKFQNRRPRKETPLKIEVVQGDITAADTEAIVNAANNHLWMGSGVAGAIKRKGGDEIERDAMSKGPIAVGQAIASTAGKLPFKCIIHAAGMGQDLRTDKSIIREVTLNSLLLADRMNLQSLAFPAIGTGVGGVNVSDCAAAMAGAIEEFAPKAKSLRQIVFVLFDKSAYDAFLKEFE